MRIPAALAGLPTQREGDWLFVRPPGSRYPEQGWKLHLSATVGSAPAVLRRALPVLRAAGCAFKVTASLAGLERLNAAHAVFSQVGKFITVYPCDTARAVALAAALDRATAGLTGPRVPSDRPLRPGSLVHYRYGGFALRQVLSPDAELLPAFSDPGGHLVPDLRHPWFEPPVWAEDPFVAAGVAQPLRREPGPIGQRYRVLRCLRQAARGGVYLAEDRESGRRVVLKEARPHVNTDRLGRDVRDRLRHEFHMLRAVEPNPWLPAAYDLFVQEGHLFAALEYLEGENLREHMARRLERGEPVPAAQLTEWAEAMLQMLASFHDRGLVVRDFNPNNLLLTAAGLRLIDLEGVWGPELPPPFYVHTVAYAPSARATRPRPAHDLFSLGATLYLATTGHDPLLAVDERPALPRLLALLQALRPDAPPALVDLIARCLGRRCASVGAARPLLAALPRPGRERYPSLARGVGDALCRSLRQGDPERPWPATAGLSTVPTNLHHGAAGIGLYLTALHAATGEPRYRAAAEAAGRWILARLRSPAHLRSPGLYFGDAGAAWFLWHLGWREEARALAAQVAALPRERADVTHGAAGVGLLQLLVDDRAGAVETGDWLLAQAPPAFYGFAHGTAGIAYFLLALHRRTGLGRFGDRAAADLQGLLAAATPLPGCYGLSWQHGPENRTLWPHWCNGAAGVGQVFLCAYEWRREPAWLEAAQRAGLAAYHGSRGGCVVQCHGTAGNAELLLDLYQATGEPAWLERAHDLAALVEAQAVRRDGVLLWPGEGDLAITPELMTGYSGVGAWFLRLSDPERRRRLVELPLPAEAILPAEALR